MVGNKELCQTNRNIQHKTKYVLDLTDTYMYNNNESGHYNINNVYKFFFWNSWDNANAIIKLDKVYLAKRNTKASYTEVHSYIFILYYYKRTHTNI